MIDFIKGYIKDSISINTAILNDEKMVKNILNIGNIIVDSYKKGGKVLLAGNGGSAADAQHIAGELVAKFKFERKALPAIALTVDSSIITAISNDTDFKYIFSRQIEALGRQGDVFIAISTSGSSENIIEAVKTANDNGLITIGLVGQNECELDKHCDYIVKVPSAETSKIQEAHLIIEHILCGIIEEKLF